MQHYIVFAFCALLLFVNKSNAGCEPANAEIDNLNQLYRNGVLETNALAQSMGNAIHVAISTRYQDIAKRKLAAAELVANVTTGDLRCATIHRRELSRVDPSSVNYCEQSTGINHAIGKSTYVKEIIDICSRCPDPVCISDIKGVIYIISAENRRDLPALARKAYECVEYETRTATDFISLINNNFFKCIKQFSL